jgi:two-component system osmolarity sensor histidine kinase EnvZ
VQRAPVRLSLFWRTFLLIAAVVVASLLAWLQLFRAAELQPRAERFAWEITSIVNLTRAGLLSASGTARIDLLGDLARNEGIQVLPAEPTDRVRPWPDARFGAPFEAKLRELLGLLKAPQVQLVMYLSATQRVVIVLVMNDLHDVRHVPVHLLLAVLPLLERAFLGRGRGIDKREPHGRPRPRRRSRNRQ